MFQECRERQELKQAAEERLAATFQCHKRRLFFWDELTLTKDERRAILDNPVIRQLQSSESALHEALVVDAETWLRYCPRADHGHVLVGPLVTRGRLVGAVAVTRAQGEPPFSAEDVTAMNRFSLHLSTRLCELPDPSNLDPLTPRERDVAQAVCRGLRNAAVARELHVSEHTVKQNLKSIYRKLEVSSRTELLRVLS